MPSLAKWSCVSAEKKSYSLPPLCSTSPPLRSASAFAELFDWSAGSLLPLFPEASPCPLCSVLCVLCFRISLTAALPNDPRICQPLAITSCASSHRASGSPANTRADMDTSPRAVPQCPRRAPACLPDASPHPKTNTRGEKRDPSPPCAACIPEFRNCARLNQNAAQPPYTLDLNPSPHENPSARDTSQPGSQFFANAKSRPHAPPSFECSRSTVPELIA